MKVVVVVDRAFTPGSDGDDDGVVTPSEALVRRAQRTPDAVALIFGDTAWTTGQVADRAASLADMMRRRGVSVGDRVVLHMHNSPQLVCAYLACYSLGVIAAPLNTQYSSRELQERFEIIEPSLYLGDEQTVTRLDGFDAAGAPACPRLLIDRDGALEPGAPQQGRSLELVRWDLDAPAVLVETTGSTGPPKLSVWTPRVLAGISRVAEARGVKPDGVILGVVPMMHSSGFSLLSASLLQGASLVIMPAFEPGSALDAVERHGVTQFVALPAMCWQLLRAQRERARDLSSLRMCLVGGDVCPPQLEREFAQAVGRPLLSHWVATEEIAATVPGNHPGTVSRLLDDVEVRLVGDDGAPVPGGEAGRLLIRSPRTIPGYWQRGATIASLPGGWFDTGDLVRMEGRWMRYAGRVKDVIVSSGRKISPVEVEDVLYRHDHVRLAVVVGVPDPEIGQRVVAAVVLSDDAPDAAMVHADLWRELEAGLAEWKRPTSLLVRDDLPRNRLTKIDRTVLAAELSRPP